LENKGFQSRENRQNSFSTRISRTDGEEWKIEFISWYNNFDLTELLEKTTKINRPIFLLRRKENNGNLSGMSLPV